MSKILKLKKLRPELVDQFSAMDKDQLLEACCGEVLDLLAHEDRVQLFMNECTDMSDTKYTLDAIKSMIADKKEHDINYDMWLQIDAGMTDEEIVAYVKKRAADANM